MPETSLVTTRKPHHFLTIIAWLLVAGIAIGVYLYQGGYLSIRQPKSLKPTTTSPAGYILLNLSYGNGHEHTYAINVSTQSLNRVPNLILTPTASHDGRYFVSAGAHGAGTAIIGDIYRYDTSLATTTLFATGATGLPRFPQLSPDGMWVVFNTPPTAMNDTNAMQPSAWGITIATERGTSHFIAHGLYPHWSPDGASILYVGDNGLHLYNIASSTDTAVYVLQKGGVNSLMTLSVSDDGNHLVWTDPYHQQLMIASIYSWHPFTAKVEKMLSVKAFFPVFSLDGSRIAFEQIDPVTSSASSTNATVMLIDTSSFVITKLITLKAFNQTSLLMTDWVNHL
jgi:Tol biopolymer transport system component